MSIRRKFNMFSTREWILYLQYKLSPEREKELNLHAENDEFLREAIEIIGEKENRPLAYQSISQLIDAVEANTGVSESKIIKTKIGASTESTSSGSGVNLKGLMIGLLGLILVGLIGYGIYYLSTEYEFGSNDDMDESIIEAEAVSETQLYADSSSMPMETLPSEAPTPVEQIENENNNSTSPAQTNPPSPAQGNNAAVTNSMENGTQQNKEETPKPTIKKPNNSEASSSLTSSKERELFDKAQDLYKEGDREGAKKILRDLRGYENPMQSQAETILKNMEN